MSVLSGPELLAATQEWLAQDPDAETRHELEQLVGTATDPSAGEKAAQAAVAELVDRFSGTLQFGTAGLRAALGAGPMRMNRVVVQRAAAGVAAHVVEVTAGAGTRQSAAASGDGPVETRGATAPRAVIGFDARKNSEVFARDTAAIFTAAGIETLLMPRPLPTPVLAWAVRSYNADVGIMVTASHNPAADNGYKVYLGGRAVEDNGRGCQIVPPHDRQIADQIAAVGDLRNVPKAESGWVTLPETIDEQYLAAIVPETNDVTGTGSGVQPRIVLTAMHGVGGPTAVEALSRAGFDDVHPVAEQFDPDPAFPTVAFPNPEEPGALDLAFELARSVDADLIIANDPDADRCAVAVADPGHPASVNGWRMLRGDEVGVLLGMAAIRQLTADRTSDDPVAPVLANSVVSSRQLGRMARAAGIEHHETLTGFKWIARVAHLAYGYEEALGYCTQPETVRDKDGISAAVAVAELARAAAANGRGLTDELAQLAVDHGLFSTDQLSIRVSDLAAIPRMMTVLRERTPTQLADSPVVEVRDLARPAPGSPLPPTDGVLLLTEDDSRVIVRPSGTEPKLKCYLETVTPVQDLDGVARARATGTAKLAAVVEQLRELFGT